MANEYFQIEITKIIKDTRSHEAKKKTKMRKINKATPTSFFVLKNMRIIKQPRKFERNTKKNIYCK